MNKFYIVQHEWLDGNENFNTAILGVFKSKDNAIKRLRKERDTLLEESYNIPLEVAQQSEYYECSNTDEEFSITDMYDYPWDRVCIIEMGFSD